LIDRLAVQRRVVSVFAGRIAETFPDHGEFAFTRPLVSGTAHDNVIANDNT
jgi:hypothetical protein